MPRLYQRSLAPVSLILIALLLGMAILPPPQPAFAATTFSRLATSFAGVADGDLDWGDYDDDGDLDFILTGSTGSATTQVWRNNGDSTFTQASTPTGVFASTTAWGDYDNDGDLDFVLAGWSGSAFTTELWRNNGNSAFGKVSTGLPGLIEGDLAWGDYDNDGDLDILMVGEILGGNNLIARVYANNGGSFSQHASFTGADNSSAAWGDYDNDGDLDFIYAGATGSGGSPTRMTAVWTNNGNGGFAQLAGTTMSAVQYSSVAWGDYDSDGDLDILLTGQATSGNVTEIWTNDGNSAFTQLAGLGIAGVSKGEGDWGDYDNDGDPDILVSGLSSNGRITQIWTNNGNSTFTQLAGTTMTGVESASVAWGDYDNDNDLDFIMNGIGGARITEIWTNTGSAANAAPASPDALAATVSGDTVAISWAAASDSQTPAAGLTYNLYLGTAANPGSVKTPLASTSTGFRHVVGLGNMEHRRAASFRNLADGTYSWGVQTIDGAFAGSPFAAQSFTINDDNAAPVLDTSSPAIVDSIAEDPESNPGTRIADLVAGRISDSDAGDGAGIAVIGADSVGGAWHYSPNAGLNWFALQSLAATSATLLAADDQTRVRFVPDANFNGQSSLSFRAWDQFTGGNGMTGVDTSTNGGATAYSSASGLATITVAAVNDQPTLDNPVADQSATEDQPFSLTLPATTWSDVDAGDSLTVTATLADGSALPAWLGFDSAARTFSGTPANGDVGLIGVTVTATDGAGASASDSFALAVVNTNDAPTLAAAIPDQQAMQATAFHFTVAAETFSDVDAGDSLAYTATLADGSALPAWLSFAPATRTFSGTPPLGSAGTLLIKVTATDQAGAAVSDSFAVVIGGTTLFFPLLMAP
jgi:hypothetical protein